MAFSFFGLGRLFKAYSEEDKRLADSIEAITGARPKNLELYKLAVRHSSVGQPAGNRAEHNERLEYLGDAVLGTIVAHYLFQRYPFKNEGFLTEIRARMVNGDALNDLALKIGLDKMVKYEGRRKQVHTHRSMYGDAMEALVGAYYLDYGFDACKRFVTAKLLATYDLEQLVESETNHKSRLIEWSQKNGYKISFDIIKEAGRSHTREFTAQVTLEGQVLASGTGFSKKKAEQSAALKAYDRVNEGKLPEGLKRRPNMTPIQRTDEGEEASGGLFREREHRHERNDDRHRHPRHSREDRQRDDRPRDDRPRDERPREERSERRSFDQGQEGRPERSHDPRRGRGGYDQRQERDTPIDRVSDDLSSTGSEQSQEQPRQEGRQERNQGQRPGRDQQPRRHGRYSVSNQDPSDPSGQEAGKQPEFTGEVPETPEGETRTRNESEGRPDSQRPERRERPQRQDRGRGGRGQSRTQTPATGDEAFSESQPVDESKIQEQDMDVIGSLPDLPTGPMAESFNSSEDMEPTTMQENQSHAGPEVKVVETYYPELPPLPEPKRKWVNVMKGASGSQNADAQREEPQASDRGSQEAKPGLDNWDAEFAQVANPTGMSEEPLPNQINDEGVQVPVEDTNPPVSENPEWVNEAAEEFRNEIRKAEDDFKDAEENLSLKPDDPGQEPGEDKDGPR